MFMDASGIDVNAYSHIHFAFAKITPDFNVDVNSDQEQFEKFIKLKKVKKIIAFGGWAFSTEAGNVPSFATSRFSI
jgi:chitinase